MTLALRTLLALGVLVAPQALLSRAHAGEREQARAVAVVVGQRSPLTQLSPEEMVQVFTARRQFWLGSVRTTVIFQQPGSPASQAFCERVLHMSCEELEKLLLQKRYRGVLTARVIFVNTSAEVQELLASNPSAIGYIWRDEAGVNVRVLSAF
jgi:hypothetical protein